MSGSGSLFLTLGCHGWLSGHSCRHPRGNNDTYEYIMTKNWANIWKYMEIYGNI